MGRSLKKLYNSRPKLYLAFNTINTLNPPPKKKVSKTYLCLQNLNFTGIIEQNKYLK